MFRWSVVCVGFFTSAVPSIASATIEDVPVKKPTATRRTANSKKPADAKTTTALKSANDTTEDNRLGLLSFGVQSTAFLGAFCDDEDFVDCIDTFTNIGPTLSVHARRSARFRLGLRLGLDIVPRA